MKIRIVTIISLIMSFSFVEAQGSFERIYDIFQASCASSSCHSNNNQSANLDLEGSGVNPMMEVYDNLVNVAPWTSFAANANNMLIKPGDPARSFLFRKVQNGLDPTLSLHPAENNPMPLTGNDLREVDIELIRQWILYGAPENGEVIDVAIIDDYYNNNGVSSVPNPPMPPEPGEGFQIHLGPYFIPPNSEDEVFLKHDLLLETGLEVTKTETFMGNESHHFIINKFLPEDFEVCGFEIGGGSDDFPEGYRDVNQASHYASLIQLGAQEPGEFELPYNTAYTWEAGTVVDLNSHYINANQNQVLAAEVYVNIYTQDLGVARQEMNTLMIPETNLNIPGDGQEVTISQELPIGLCYSSGLYLWGLTSHTHALGVDFDIYKSNFNGDLVEHLFDASCFIDGVPGCMDEFYDYQHPPTRTWDDYYPLSGIDWLKQEAKYVNNTGETVNFGLTSEDEMLIMFLFFVTDTSGLINTAPVLEDDIASTDMNEAVNITVLENDNDDGVIETESMAIIEDPSDGTATVNEDGTITYTPDDGFSGDDVFTYVVCDNGIPPLCDTAEVNVTVNSIVGVFNESFQLIKAYPNPTTGAIAINNPFDQINEVAVFDLSGQKLSQLSFINSGNKIEVDLEMAQLDHGVYWIVVTTQDNEQGISKVVYYSK